MVWIGRRESNMHISYKPLWHTLLERDMRKEDLRLAAGMTTNMIANMSKEGKHISMDTLARIRKIPSWQQWRTQARRTSRRTQNGAAWAPRRQGRPSLKSWCPAGSWSARART
ncbi:hypothetical protein WKT04_00610 [Oscillospiraceae bacterium HCN-4035]